LDTPETELFVPVNAEDLEAARAIFREYASTLTVDLDFQDFGAELATLPGDYAAPRGALLLARVGGAVAGCCALRPMDSSDYPNAAEMKRLYVRKAFRGFGLGRQLSRSHPGRRRAKQRLTACSSTPWTRWRRRAHSMKNWALPKFRLTTTTRFPGHITSRRT